MNFDGRGSTVTFMGIHDDQHVLIVGAGIGGLALAQALRRAGIRCSVYERSPGLTWGGYLIHLNADGGAALRRCLPEDLYRLYVATSRRPPRRDLVVLVDHLGAEIGTRPHLGPANDPVEPHTSVHRRTLCQILRSGIEDSVHFGHELTGLRTDGDHVVAQFADGRTARGTLLVAADGINSAVRRQLLPEVREIPVAEHALLSRAALTDELRSTLLPAFADSFVMVRDRVGTHLATGVYEPRWRATDATADIAPSVVLDPVDDYVAVNLELQLPESLRRRFFDAPQAELHAWMREAVADWHPALRHLVDCVAPGSIVQRSIRMLTPADTWPSGNVTFVGDAIHAMPPMYGNGANSALCDAAELADALTGDGPLTASVARYEEDMRARTFPILREATRTLVRG
jgi:2-polyprenyl-6-methoxyphenol hydroxylase-like FAD-dependent oxidoreductase